jgi:hypothetical protein
MATCGGDVTADPALLARFTVATGALARDARVCFGTASSEHADDFTDALTDMDDTERAFVEAMFRAGVQATVARLVERRMVTTAEIIEAYEGAV